jgi:hypothetical protein
MSRWSVPRLSNVVANWRQPFGPAEPVDVGGVEEGDAPLVSADESR